VNAFFFPLAFQLFSHGPFCFVIERHYPFPPPPPPPPWFPGGHSLPDWNGYQYEIALSCPSPSDCPEDSVNFRNESLPIARDLRARTGSGGHSRDCFNPPAFPLPLNTRGLRQDSYATSSGFIYGSFLPPSHRGPLPPVSFSAASQKIRVNPRDGHPHREPFPGKISPCPEKSFLRNF